MRILIIIPCYNEESFVSQTLDSLVVQSVIASKIIVVNDHSTDRTAHIVQQYADQHENIELLHHVSSNENIPGSKVIRAFNFGLSMVDITDYDIICKFDADLIFPNDYLEKILTCFGNSPTNGMVAGHCAIESNKGWILEKGTNKDHIRGALKAYRQECFKAIDGLKESIGWDTIDEMLARYYQWNVVTIPDLHVKHLKPTGTAYQKKARYMQGEAFYKMRYGFLLTAITACKMAWNKRNVILIYDYLKGYQLASNNQTQPIITPDQGQFIRSYRWKGIWKKTLSLFKIPV